MRQIEPFLYEVNLGETVRIEIEPHGLGAQVRAAQNGVALPPQGPPEKPYFEFKVSEPVGNAHFAMVWYQFPANMPNNARYEVTVHATGGDAPTSVEDRPITNRGPKDKPVERRLAYEFRVVAG